MVLHLTRGDVIDQRALLRRLADLQYKRNEIELARGTYRVRGDVIDIHPAESDEEALRVELFDDEIEAPVPLRPADRRGPAQGRRATPSSPRPTTPPRARPSLKAVEQIKVGAQGPARPGCATTTSWWRPSAWSSAPCSTWR